MAGDGNFSGLRDDDGSRAESFADRNGRSLVCDHPGCTVQTPFTRRSDLKKHLDRHNRPYRCDKPDCEAPAFGDIGGLFRHQREVHKIRDGDRPIVEHFCPDPSCDRNSRGFPRRWNLLEHQRRIHGISRDDSDERRVPARHRHSGYTSRSGGRAARRTSSRLTSPLSSDFHNGDDGAGAGEGENHRPTSISHILHNRASSIHSSVNAVGNGGEDGYGVRTELHARLKRLREQKSDLDQDIDALEHTLRVLDK